MPTGVEGFVPARLRMARAARALLQRELAVLVDRSDGTVSKWESGDQAPEPSVIHTLSTVLEVDSGWFFKPADRASGASFFRSLKSALGRMRDKAEAKLDFIESIFDAISMYIDLPDVDIPDIIGGRDFRTLRGSDVEHCARLLREHWSLNEEPIDDLLLVIENAGVIVGHDELGSEKLDGVSRWSNGRPYMLLARDKNVGVRRRFDAAHELGHIVLHKHVTPDELYAHFNLIEEQAMLFAGAFLLPDASFGDDVRSLSLDALLGIKLKWKVSVAAMIKRLSAMERVSADYERKLWQYYSYRRWRGFEPLDDVIEVEQPHNLAASINIALSEGGISRSELFRNINLRPKDISNLTGISESLLTPSNVNLIRLHPVVKSNIAPSQEAKVINISDRGKRL
ncbi:helix-turn-helix domain-containing protein [Segnochrobactrum spirostomi]|uniref:ImmA/IrrE family metallo-endopeptidase n=1 Tax=Segnochrobactrum spirostomi TaxID=2608987 RepID=A0A6A7Y8D9_9HYPH|nr:ImmA/IrrE family metallo-endopeptidase [Segnochrobactrum spirostomi]MQT14607.1 ImmA/IrrE family metallo-endopeptidase [Segnochrobactrum spirostomi]